MAATKGIAGVITIGGTAVGKINGYTLDSSDTVIDGTGFDSTSRELAALGLPTFTLSCDVTFDTADAGQDAIRTAVYSGASVAVVAYPEGNTTGKMKLTWAAMVIESTKFASASMEGYVQAAFVLKGGEPVETTV